MDLESRLAFYQHNSAALSVILYGPKKMCEDVGAFCESHEFFLQDPRECDRNVKYCNPHRLSSLDFSSCPVTYDIQTTKPGTLDTEDLSPQPELLDILNVHEDLPEASQPAEIQTQLERHQKQALTFMLQREQGWTFDSSGRDLWGLKNINLDRLFINMVSGDSQQEEPQQFRGGIIADPMGLGKTLTMIALVAATLQEEHYGICALYKFDERIETTGATLIVVPPPLLDTWEEQLSQHVIPGALEWCRHHGKSRLSEISELKNFHVVLTTYQTVSAEWKNGNQTEQSILFSTQWKRLILDEAHYIRNSNSKLAKAACSVPAAARWAVTGTPIQNRLGDLAALFKFLDVYPYGDTKRFDRDIALLWKNGQPEEAVERLKRLAKYLILRRPKSTIDLPTRKDLSCPVEFTTEERTFYDQIKYQAIENFENASMNYDRVGISRSRFVNVIQQINALRMICNLGIHYNYRHEIKLTDQMVNSSETADWREVAQQAFNFAYEVGALVCQRCKSPVSIMERFIAESGDHLDTNALFFECDMFICPECIRRSRGELTCSHEPSHLSASVSLSPLILEGSMIDSANPDHGRGVNSMEMQSKVVALLRQLKALPSDVKSIVFSTWRMSLDTVEAGLKEAKIKCLRYDGKVPQKERQGVIEKVRRDPSVTVLLLTLSCGAVGLTLTEASYAFLMEPHWNPTVEEQALARVHRLSQKKEVTTIRFYVKNTFEERVMTVQQTKEDLAGTLFSSDNSSKSGNAAHLERLCSLL